MGSWPKPSARRTASQGPWSAPQGPWSAPYRRRRGPRARRIASSRGWKTLRRPWSTPARSRNLPRRPRTGPGGRRIVPWVLQGLPEHFRTIHGGGGPFRKDRGPIRRASGTYPPLQIRVFHGLQEQLDPVDDLLKALRREAADLLDQIVLAGSPLALHQLPLLLTHAQHLLSPRRSGSLRRLD